MSMTATHTGEENFFNSVGLRNGLHFTPWLAERSILQRSAASRFRVRGLQMKTGQNQAVNGFLGIGRRYAVRARSPMMSNGLSWPDPVVDSHSQARHSSIGGSRPGAARYSVEALASLPDCTAVIAAPADLAAWLLK